MKYIAATFLLFWSIDSWSCSCFRIASIAETIAREPVLIEGQVVSREQVTSKEYGTQVDSVTLKVIKKLKGVVSSESVTVEGSMCYASLYPELMKVGHSYVLPLSEPINNGPHQLAGCAHSGMELISNKLYTFEQAKGIKRRLQLYKSYSEFLSELKK